MSTKQIAPPVIDEGLTRGSPIGFKPVTNLHVVNTLLIVAFVFWTALTAVFSIVVLYSIVNPADGYTQLYNQLYPQSQAVASVAAFVICGVIWAVVAVPVFMLWVMTKRSNP